MQLLLISKDVSSLFFLFFFHLSIHSGVCFHHDNKIAMNNFSTVSSSCNDKAEIIINRVAKSLGTDLSKFVEKRGLERSMC